MTASKRSTAPALADEIPDLSALEWQERFAAAPVKRGRPKADETKVSTTIRLSRQVLDAYRATGPGWQSRINETLERAARRMKQSAG